jgi:D-alanyl-D-alanine carboxypeptidase
MKTLEPSPISAQADGEAAEASAQPVGYDGDTGLPLYGDDFNLFVINEAHPAESDFAPVLAEAAGVEVDERIAPALSMLVEAAQADGIELQFDAGYVSYSAQEALYEKQVEALQAAGSTIIMAREDAKRTVPAPGESDMQTGLCVTLAGSAEDFAGTAAYGWLQSHMGAYGFVFRYPAGKADYTGVEQNDLVLRYVGPENAAAMRRLSMCLEEYIAYVG